MATSPNNILETASHGGALFFRLTIADRAQFNPYVKRMSTSENGRIAFCAPKEERQKERRLTKSPPS